MSKVFFPGEDRWVAVQLAVHAPFFWVDFAHKGEEDDDFEYTSTFMLSTTAELDSVIKQHESKEIRLKSVSLVSPGYVNESGQWQMEPLKAIWSCDSTISPGRRVYLYETAKGARYPEVIAEVSEEMLKNATVRTDIESLCNAAST
ncbi:MAG: hypothetical protein Q8S02_11715 [Hydrogenophaga sp.]|nr:hypothetical protein [Hydrogenophaga sp.]